MHFLSLKLSYYCSRSPTPRPCCRVLKRRRVWHCLVPWWLPGCVTAPKPKSNADTCLSTLNVLSLSTVNRSIWQRRFLSHPLSVVYNDCTLCLIPTFPPTVPTQKHQQNTLTLTHTHSHPHSHSRPHPVPPTSSYLTMRVLLLFLASLLGATAWAQSINMNTPVSFVRDRANMILTRQGQFGAMP